MNAKAVNALECPLYSLLTSPVERFHNLAKLSEDAIKILKQLFHKFTNRNDLLFYLKKNYSSHKYKCNILQNN